MSDFISQQAASGPGAGLQSNIERTVSLKVVGEMCVLTRACALACKCIDTQMKTATAHTQLLWYCRSGKHTARAL